MGPNGGSVAMDSVFIISCRWVGVLTHVGWNKVWILTMVPVAEQVPQLLRDKQVGLEQVPQLFNASR
jgi:hypothetical protein